MNLPVTIAESNSGLVPAAVASELMGAGGEWAPPASRDCVLQSAACLPTSSSSSAACATCKPTPPLPLRPQVVSC